MMDLDEAIQHCEEVAEENEEIYEAHCRIYSKEVVERYPSPPCKKCAEEHHQLAEWLKDYKRLLGESRSEIPNKSEIPTSCGDAISREAVLDAVSSERYDYWALFEYVKQLPSVTPQPIECEERKSGNCPFYAN